jgi:hypothetical protein
MPCVFHLAVHQKTRGAKGGTPSFCAFLHLALLVPAKTVLDANHYLDQMKDEKVRI